MAKGSRSSINKSGSLAVIGAGLPRTGTFSTKVALELLLGGGGGGGPCCCYHMVSNVIKGTRRDREFWSRVKDQEEEITRKEWVDFMEGGRFRAGVDFPIALYYRELMEAFPDAKVILTVRDPVSWYESVKNSILVTRYLLQDNAYVLSSKLFGMHENLVLAHDLANHARRGMTKGMFDTIESGQDESVAFYSKWVDEVTSSVPEERLLVFDVRQGWKPLCNFLGFDVPDTPFPKLNDTNAMSSMFNNARRISYVIVYGLPLLLAVVLGCVFIF